MALKEIEKLTIQIGEMAFTNREDVVDIKYAKTSKGLIGIAIVMQSGKHYLIQIKEIEEKG